MRTRTLVSALVLCSAILIPIMGHSENWSPPSWMTSLNSSSRDLEPWLSADGKTMYFSSDRTGSLELYVTCLVSGAWTAPIRLPQPINDPLARDGHANLTLDGRYLYFHSNRPSPYNAGTYAWRDCDIWVAENINGQWQAPAALGPAVNSAKMDYAPYISVDGQRLIFASDRAGGYGQHDFYTSDKVGGEWQPAQNMGAPINTSANQVHPSLSYTGRFLFLSDLSNVYRSEIVNGAWQTPIKLPSIVNNCGSGTESSIYNDCTNTLYYYKMCGPAGSWDMATALWLDPPEQNPCDYLVIPDGQWRVRVTLLEASAVLRNDIYIDAPISQLLIRNSLKNVGAVVTTPFLSAEELIFHIHVKAGAMGLGEYDHYSDSEFARVERTDPLRYLVGFEDLPAEQADWDFNDTVLLIELIGVEVNIWENVNYLGESQVVERAPAGEDTTLAMPLIMGDALMAAAVIPGAGLAESTYGIMVEGDPALYGDVLAGAPFESNGTVLKLELTSGQTATVGGAPMEIAVDLGDRTGMTTDAKLFRYNQEADAWEQVLDQYMDYDSIVASTENTGLYAVGELPAVDYSLHVDCAVLPVAGHGPAGAAALLLLPLMIAAAARFYLREADGKTGTDR